MLMLATMSSGSHVGNEHAKMVWWDPLTMNGLVGDVGSRKEWSKFRHTGQQSLDAPMTGFTP